tara:strand:+ start:11310 stop:12197 length:888 start_codon:yes stop_codon:yes gene_type:complete
MTRSIDRKQVDSTANRSTRRAGRGGKLRLPPAQLQEHSIAGTWLDSMTHHFGDDAMEWGLEAAQSGRVRSIELGVGFVSASVSEEGEGGRRVTVSVPTLDEPSWSRVVDAMASEAVYTARFMEGECPPNLLQLFLSCNVDLVPGRDEAVGIRTKAPSGSARRRAAAVAWLIAERLVVEPLAMLRLRGQGVDDMVQRIRQRRSMRLSEGAHAHPPLNLQGELEAAVPLAESIEQFWRSPSLDQLPPRMPAQHIPHALLRRLGASPMDGKFPLSGLLETIYDQVGEASRAMLEDDPD